MEFQCDQRALRRSLDNFSNQAEKGRKVLTSGKGSVSADLLNVAMTSGRAGIAAYNEAMDAEVERFKRWSEFLDSLPKFLSDYRFGELLFPEKSIGRMTDELCEIPLDRFIEFLDGDSGITSGPNDSFQFTPAAKEATSILKRMGIDLTRMKVRRFDGPCYVVGLQIPPSCFEESSNQLRESKEAYQFWRSMLYLKEGSELTKLIMERIIWEKENPVDAATVLLVDGGCRLLSVKKSLSTLGIKEDSSGEYKPGELARRCLELLRKWGICGNFRSIRGEPENATLDLEIWPKSWERLVSKIS